MQSRRDAPQCPGSSTSPKLEGEFRQTQLSTFTALVLYYSYCPSRSPLPPRAQKRLGNSVLSALSDKQVKWTVRPRYCGCQVTNATSCILRLRKGTTRVNMRSHEGGESAQTAERKRLGERCGISEKSPSLAASISSPRTCMMRRPIAKSKPIPGPYSCATAETTPILGAYLWKAVDWEEKSGRNRNLGGVQEDIEVSHGLT